MKNFWACFLFVVILIVAHDVQKYIGNRFDRLEKLIFNSASVHSASDSVAHSKNRVFEVFHAGIWYTQRGALMFPVNGFDEIIDPELRFHEIWFQPDIQFAVGKLGSSQWLLDEMGRKISEAFSGFSMQDGQIYGETATGLVPVKIKE